MKVQVKTAFIKNLFFKPAYPTIVRYGVQITTQFIVDLKKCIYSFLLIFLRKNVPSGSYHQPPGSIFWKSISLQQKREKDTMKELKQCRKSNVCGYWWQVLINLIIFAPFNPYCFAVPWSTFKHPELLRFFNLTNKISTKKLCAQE